MLDCFQSECEDAIDEASGPETVELPNSVVIWASGMFAPSVADNLRIDIAFPPLSIQYSAEIPSIAILGYAEVLPTLPVDFYTDEDPAAELGA